VQRYGIERDSRELKALSIEEMREDLEEVGSSMVSSSQYEV
jgi:hypothetical protein